MYSSLKIWVPGPQASLASNPNPAPHSASQSTWAPGSFRRSHERQHLKLLATYPQTTLLPKPEVKRLRVQALGRIRCWTTEDAVRVLYTNLPTHRAAGLVSRYRIMFVARSAGLDPELLLADLSAAFHRGTVLASAVQREGWS